MFGSCNSGITKELKEKLVGAAVLHPILGEPTLRREPSPLQAPSQVAYPFASVNPSSISRLCGCIRNALRAGVVQYFNAWIGFSLAAADRFELNVPIAEGGPRSKLTWKVLVHQQSFMFVLVDQLAHTNWGCFHQSGFLYLLQFQPS